MSDRARGDRGRRPGEERRPRRRRLPLGRRLLLAALVILLAALVALGLILTRRDGDRADFPDPLPAPGSASAAEFDDFVGSETCSSCHRAEYDVWRGSTHGRAGGAPAERAIAPFDGRPIHFSDAVVVPERSGEGVFAFRLREEGRRGRRFVVAGVVGGGHMVGGGTQGFFSEFPDGTLRFLPFDYHAGAGVWFCQTGGRSDSGWQPITREMKLTDCSDWPPSRVLGGHENFPNCQGCHGSQIELTFDASTKRYLTRYTTLAVNCESCHGPGRRHVEIARSDSAARVADIGMRALATLSEDESLQVCFQCHAVKDQLRPGHHAGEAVEDYYSLGLPLLSYRPYFPDGRIRLFAYQATHRFSDCYLNGTMTCVDCHDPHGQSYRDVFGRPLVGRFADGQCTGCHPSKAERPERHTHHAADSEGSRCVACHMPYLQEADVGERLRYARSDHSIPIPRPTLDTIFATANACQRCHTGWSLPAVQERMTAMYGELKPLKANVAGLIRARGVTDTARAAELMIGPRNGYTVLQIQGLAYYLLTYLAPDMERLEPEVEARLSELTRSVDDDLAALALAALHLARGSDPSVRSLLAQRLAGLGPRDRAVRERWVRVLEWRGDAYLQSGETERALVSYRRAAEILPGDAGVSGRIAAARADMGDYDGAIAAYRESLAADSLQPRTVTELAFALVQTGQLREGVDLFRRAIDMNPWEARTFLSLGQVYRSQGSTSDAIAALERAVELEPSHAEAYFALGVAYVDAGEREKAIAALERGLELQQRAEGARALLERLRSPASDSR